jgi:tetratricopeptide (TPR) repeat protein
MKNFEISIEYCDNVLNIDPKLVNVWKYKGAALANRNMYLEAIKCFDKALEIDPIDDDNWIINEKHLL